MIYMKIYKGLSASKGISIGNAFLLTGAIDNIEKVTVGDNSIEIKKFNDSVEISLIQIEKLKQKAINTVGKEESEIFEIHKMMVQDLDYQESVLEIISKENCNSEYAVYQTKNIFYKIFADMDDPYMNDRKSDVIDISDRIIKNILGNNEDHIEKNDNVIYFAVDLTPSATISLDKQKILGFVTKIGSSASHSAILARNLNVPAVVGIGDNFSNFDFSKCFIIDGISGIVIENPDTKTMIEYRDKIMVLDEEEKKLSIHKDEPAITKDGIHIEINGNIGGVEDAESSNKNGADGIGLFRSEFLYLQGSDFPSEEVQFNSYKKVLETMQGKRVIVRTLDLGSDKQASYFNIENEDNPALGYRAIRICLSQIGIFKTQLRALYRSSIYGKLAIMFPMIVSVEEIKKVKIIVDEVKKELDNDKILYSSNVEIGVMIETPASVMISDKLAKEVDFFSVGTNDLTQYTMAADRMNANISEIFDPGNISIMRMIKMTVDNANKQGIWVGICGESASDTRFTKLYLSMGIKELSISPPMIPKLKEFIRRIDISEVRDRKLSMLD